MGIRDGILKAQYEVHCRVCEQAVLGLGPTKSGAAHELMKSYGWRTIGGIWHCSNCAGAASATPPTQTPGK